MTPTERFVQARDFLQQHRLDYDSAWRDYRRPELDAFNWAIDYFDHQAKDNATPALWVVEEDGSERKISYADLAARSNQVAEYLRNCGVRRRTGSSCGKSCWPGSSWAPCWCRPRCCSPAPTWLTASSADT
jgi:hypothetical protein